MLHTIWRSVPVPDGNSNVCASTAGAGVAGDTSDTMSATRRLRLVGRLTRNVHMSDTAAVHLKITRAQKELKTIQKELERLAHSENDDADDFVRAVKGPLDKIEKCLKHAKAALG
jgi:hypothetical protein